MAPAPLVRAHSPDAPLLSPAGHFLAFLLEPVSTLVRHADAVWRFSKLVLLDAQEQVLWTVPGSRFLAVESPQSLSISRVENHWYSDAVAQRKAFLHMDVRPYQRMLGLLGVVHLPGIVTVGSDVAGINALDVESGALLWTVASNYSRLSREDRFWCDSCRATITLSGGTMVGLAARQFFIPLPMSVSTRDQVKSTFSTLGRNPTSFLSHLPNELLKEIESRVLQGYASSLLYFNGAAAIHVPRACQSALPTFERLSFNADTMLRHEKGMRSIADFSLANSSIKVHLEGQIYTF
jgi:hypothetical protein